MDNETVHYIITYFSQLLEEKERIAIKHTHSLLKHSGTMSASAEIIYRKNGWITNNQNALDLLKDGYEAFEVRVANRILKENSDKVFLNLCPKCSKLARTPYAKQCRHCGYNWH